jgi:hypothetical protein
VEYGWLSAAPPLKNVRDPGVILNLPERVEAAEPGYQHDVKTLAGCGPIPIGHRQAS